MSRPYDEGNDLQMSKEGHTEHVEHESVSEDELAEIIKGKDIYWWKGSHLRMNLICCLIIITSMTNGYVSSPSWLPDAFMIFKATTTNILPWSLQDGSIMNGLQTLPEWQAVMGTPTGSTLGLLNAIQSIGGIAALPFNPYLCDILGRRWPIVLGSAIMLGGTALQTASNGIGMFIGGRALIGFGLSIAGGTAPITVTEIAHPKYRPQLTSVGCLLFSLGFINVRSHALNL